MAQINTDNICGCQYLMTYDIITIGDTTIDTFIKLSEATVNCTIDHDQCLLCVNYADKIPVEETLWAVAGNSTNAAVGFSRLGFKTAIYTHIGNDDSGNLVTKTLRGEGVNREYILTDRNRRTNHSTVINFKGERTIFVYHVQRAYQLPKLGQTSWIYLSSMAQGSESIFPALVKYLEKNGRKLVYQPGTFQLRYGAKKSLALLHQTEILAVNKEEAMLYTGQKYEATIKNLLLAVLKLGPKLTLVTNGPKGVYASDGHEFWFLAADPKVPRLEATGAGDSFTTGFTAARMQNLPIPEALRWGTLNSQSVIQYIGPQAGLLTKQQMEQALKKDRYLKPRLF